MIKKYSLYCSVNKKISLSTPIYFRSRCKFCGGFPKYYFFVRQSFTLKNVKVVIESFRKVNKIMSRMCLDFYLMVSPKDINNVVIFDYSLECKSYSPRYHRCIGVPALEVVEYLHCECNRTLWAFREASVQRRPEIINRKTPKRTPKVFNG